MEFLNLLKGLSVVFPVIMSTVASLMASGVTYNMLVQKQCSPGGPPEDINKFICPDTSIIDNITGILATKAAIQAVVSAVCGFSFGWLRDLTGKSKLLMYIGVSGESICVAASFVSAFDWNSSPWMLAIIQAFVAGGFGESIMQMGAACILMAESSPEELPLRMQLYIVATLLTTMIGGLTTTLIVTTFGYLWLFVLCFCLQMVALLLTIIVVKSKNYERKSFQDTVEAFKKVFTWRENVLVLWLMLTTSAIAPIILTCEALYSGKFVQVVFRYSMYQGQILGLYGFFVAIAGSVVGPVILRTLFHCKELSIGIIVCIANSIAASLHAFANTELLLYLCGLAYFLKMATLAIPNTIIGTIVDKDELGTYLGINAILVSCIPIGITSLYQEVSRQNSDTWVGAFYFVSAGCFLFLAVLFSVSYCFYVEPQKPAVTESKEDLGQNVENGKSSLPEDITEM